MTRVLVVGINSGRNFSNRVFANAKHELSHAKQPTWATSHFDFPHFFASGQEYERHWKVSENESANTSAHVFVSTLAHKVLRDVGLLR